MDVVILVSCFSVVLHFKPSTLKYQFLSPICTIRQSATLIMSMQSPRRSQRMHKMIGKSGSSTKHVIGYLCAMVLVSATSMIFSFYRSIAHEIGGNAVDFEWTPAQMSSYLRVNATTESSSFLSTELHRYLDLSGWNANANTPENDTQETVEASKSSPYTYAFVIGGCNPDKPAYRNYIYNILVATRILREQGSKADVVVFFQMSYDSALEALPGEDVRILNEMNILHRYIPKSKVENFFKTMLDKFRVLGLTEYRRVLFMDGDVMPTGNLDYLFELSDGENAILKKNFIVTGREEPANGGFFMLSPGEGELEEMQQIIHDREVEAQSLPYPYFDPVVGWGHKIVPPDKWEVLSNSGTNWTFWAGKLCVVFTTILQTTTSVSSPPLLNIVRFLPFSAFADQGLLYHWVKYAKRSVSIAYQDTIQNFGALPNGTIVLENTLVRPFANHSKPIKCLNLAKLCKMNAPRSDFVHFTGRKKPWFHGPSSDQSEETRLQSASHFWFYHLGQLNDELHLGLNFSSWETGKSRRPLLGMYPLYGAVLTSETNLLSSSVGDVVSNSTIDNHTAAVSNVTSHHLVVTTGSTTKPASPLRNTTTTAANNRAGSRHDEFISNATLTVVYNTTPVVISLSQRV
jgi:hypothetical protein